MKKSYDRMDGHTFEHYCAGLLRRNGFHHVEVTRGSGEQGIDILAWKHRKNMASSANVIPIILETKQSRKPMQA